MTVHRTVSPPRQMTIKLVLGPESSQRRQEDKVT